MKSLYFMEPRKVSKEHQNRIVIACLYEVNNSDEILLREYTYDVVDQTKSLFWEKEVERTYLCFPKIYYDENKTFMQMQIAYWADLKNGVIEKDVVLNIVRKFRFATSVGCQHYMRGCLLKCPDCHNFFGCRFCHNDVVDDHELRRYDVMECKCRFCGHEQTLQQYCVQCQESFASYYCQSCHYLEDMSPEEKPIYHAKETNLCVVGVQERHVYCNICKHHINDYLFASHNCIEKVGNCVICLDDLDDSINPYEPLPCKHYMHVHCKLKYIQNQGVGCPICRRTLFDDGLKQVIFQIYYDAFNQYDCHHNHVYLFSCNDCGKSTLQPLSLTGYGMCSMCFSFNTRREDEKELKQLKESFDTDYESMCYFPPHFLFWAVDQMILLVSQVSITKLLTFDSEPALLLFQEKVSQYVANLDTQLESYNLILLFDIVLIFRKICGVSVFQYVVPPFSVPLHR